MARANSNIKKDRSEKKKQKISREEKLANALKKNIKLRKK